MKLEIGVFGTTPRNGGLMRLLPRSITEIFVANSVVPIRGRAELNHLFRGMLFASGIKTSWGLRRLPHPKRTLARDESSTTQRPGPTLKDDAMHLTIHRSATALFLTAAIAFVTAITTGNDPKLFVSTFTAIVGAFLSIFRILQFRNSRAAVCETNPIRNALVSKYEALDTHSEQSYCDSPVLVDSLRSVENPHGRKPNVEEGSAFSS